MFGESTFCEKNMSISQSDYEFPMTEAKTNSKMREISRFLYIFILQ